MQSPQAVATNQIKMEQKRDKRGDLAAMYLQSFTADDTDFPVFVLLGRIIPSFSVPDLRIYTIPYADSAPCMASPLPVSHIRLPFY